MKDSLRRSLASGMRHLLLAGSRPYPLPTGGPALVVAPHADDETLGLGGLISAKGARGQPVFLVVLTDNRHSHPGHPQLPPAALGARRREETLAAARILGIPSGRVHFLDAPDGQLDRLDPTTRQRVIEELTRLLQTLRPAEIFVPYLGDGSTEHDAAHWLVRQALARSDAHPVLWEYVVWAWWNPLRLARQLARPEQNYHLVLDAARGLKHRALACHASQVAPLHPWPQPVLPPVLAELCASPFEFFFHRPHP